MMSTAWNFIQKQIFQLEWLHEFLDTFFLSTGMKYSGQVAHSVYFFISDLITILFLLVVLIFIISYVQTYVSPERTKKVLGKYTGFPARVIAAVFGTVTPFCCCSSIPLFIGFTSAGLPVGITFSFLISSPLVDIASLVLLGSIFGWKIAVAYMLVGIILAVVGGTLLEKMDMGKYVVDFTKQSSNIMDVSQFTQKNRMKYACKQVKYMVKRLFFYIIIGVLIGAIIHDWVPSTWIENTLGTGNPFAVILATIISIPMHGDIFGIIPIAEALFEKSVGIGTILAFMMGLAAFSIPSLIMLKEVIKPKLFAMFTGILSVGIILIGYSFNLLQGYLV